MPASLPAPISPLFLIDALIQPLHTTFVHERKNRYLINYAPFLNKHLCLRRPDRLHYHFQSEKIPLYFGPL